MVVDGGTLGSGSIRETDITWKENGQDGFVSWSGRVGSVRVGSKAVLDPGFASICISVREGVLVSH